MYVSGVMHHMTMYSFVYCSMELVVDAGAVLLGLRIIAAARLKNSNGGVTLEKILYAYYIYISSKLTIFHTSLSSR